MSESVETSEASSAGMDRRSVLRAAVAAGVGVAVWSSPSITSIGGTPAYADMCTAGHQDYALGSRNTDCSCGKPNTATGKLVRYKDLHTPCAGDGSAFPGTWALTDGPGGTPVGNNGTCPKNPEDGDQNAGISASPTNTNLYCKSVVRLWQGGSCGNTFQEFVGPVVQGTGFYPLPGISCTSNGNIFISVLLRCSVEPECL